MKTTNKIISSTKSPQLKTKYKYIYFTDVSDEYPTRKIKTFYCYNKSGWCLGIVEWRFSWRQYWWIADDQIGLTKSCLDDIGDFISQLMRAKNE